MTRMIPLALLVGALGCTKADATGDEGGDTGGDGGAAATTGGGDGTATGGGTDTGGSVTTGTDGEPTPDPGGAADNLVLEGTFDGHSFVEILDVEYLDGYVFFCAGTKGLAIYNANELGGATYIVHSGGLGTGSHSQYPRCQHIAFGERPAHAGTGRLDVFVTNRGDETQPTPWIKWVRFEDGIAQVQQSYNKTNLPVLDTLPGDPHTRSFEGIAFAEGLIYAAVHNEGVVVIDTANDKLSVIGTVEVTGNAYAVRVLDNGALAVATSDTGLQVFDRADPKVPTFAGSAAFEGPLTRLASDDNRVYGAAGGAGLAIFDVNDPTAPTLLSTFDTPGTVMDVNVSGGRVALANWTDLRVVDVSDPTAPWLFAAETVPASNQFSRVLGVDIVDDRVFAGEWTALVSYRLDPDHTPPDIRAAQTELTFEADTTVRAMVVENEGLLPLEVAAEVAGPYAVDPAAQTIAPGEKGLLEVTATGTLEPSGLTLTTNDPDEGTVTVPIRLVTPGQGVGIGDAIPADWQVLDPATGQAGALVDRIEGKVALLAYFATF